MGRMTNAEWAPVLLGLGSATLAIVLRRTRPADLSARLLSIVMAFLAAMFVFVAVLGA